ncbi:hypothetical protein T484DRAFT_1754955 [Baffinella frigidus]|nr:hypothetical protein T484DRAFT_1754955 [Cryptophyta sp. CCMP2293]
MDVTMRYVAWSACFDATLVLIHERGSERDFEVSFEAFQAWWESQPPAATGKRVRGTRLKPAPALRQEEYDQLLNYAVQKSTYQSVLLLEGGASPNAKSRQLGKASFLWCAEKRCETLLRLFIAKGASLSSSSDVSGDVLVCVAKRSLAMVKIVVEAGAVVDGACDNMGRNALGAAVAAGKEDIVAYLVEKGACINKRMDGGAWGCTAAHHVRCTHEDCKPPKDNFFNYNNANAYPPPNVCINCNESMLVLLYKLGASLFMPCAAVYPGIITPQGVRRDQKVLRPVFFCTKVMDALIAVEQQRVDSMNERRLAVAMSLHPRLGAGAMLSCLQLDGIQMVMQDPDSSCILVRPLVARVPRPYQKGDRFYGKIA